MIFAGKGALVTGAASGIGRATARLLSEEGARLALLDINKAGLQETLAGLRGGNRHRACVVDVCDAGRLEALVAEIVEEFGDIDVLVNCAGRVERRTLFEITPEDWDRIYAVNVRAPFVLTRAIARHMIGRGKGGAIVNVSSIAGKVARADKAHYASSKAALIHFSRCAAMELGPYGITVNVVCPGPTETPMIQRPVTEEYIRRHQIVLGRVAQPEDVARAILFLASPSAGHITGQALNIDGGEVMF